MEQKLKDEIEQTVREILAESDMGDTTEFQIRQSASRKLNLDLDKPEFKAFVRHVVNAFLEEQNAKEEDDAKEEEEAEEEEEEEDGGKQKQEYDEDGNLIICRLTAKRKVAIQNFKGMALVSIREYYYKDGKDMPTSKGISLNGGQWAGLKKNIPAIEKAIKKIQDRD